MNRTTNIPNQFRTFSESNSPKVKGLLRFGTTGSASKWFDDGCAAQKRGNLPESELCYRNAIAAAPGHWKAHYNLGLVLYGLDQIDDMEQCFIRVVSLNEELSRSINMLGIAHFRRGRFIVARRCFELVLRRVDRKYPKTWHNLAVVCAAMGDHAAARAAHLEHKRLLELARTSEQHSPDVCDTTMALKYIPPLARAV